MKYDFLKEQKNFGGEFMDLKKRINVKGIVVLGLRDYELLKDLFFSKVCSLEHLSKRHFPGKHRTTASKRLNRLFMANYITKVRVYPDCKPVSVFSITPKGLSTIASSLPGKLIRRECRSDNINHDLELSIIRDYFLQATCVKEIKTENELQSFFRERYEDIYEPFQRLNSDLFLLLTYEEEDYEVAVEYESCPKNLKRLSRYLLNYHLEEDIQAVLYICATNNILKNVMKVTKEYAKSFAPKIYCCTLKDFKNESQIAIFENGDGKKFPVNFHKDKFTSTSTTR